MVRFCLGAPNSKYKYLMILHYELSDELSNLFTPYEYETTKAVILLEPEKISTEFKNKLNEVDLFVRHGKIFNNRPGTVYNIHIDAHKQDPALLYAKINFVLGGKDSYMNWFKVNDDKTYHTRLDPRGDAFLAFDPDDCTEIYRAYIPERKCVLLDVGIPHSMTNPVEFRTCFSMVLGDTRTNTIIKFDDAKKRLEKFFV